MRFALFARQRPRHRVEPRIFAACDDGIADADRRSALVNSLDNLAQGVHGTALIAFLSSLTSARYTATQYALFSSLYALPGKLLEGTSGFVVDAIGLPDIFPVHGGAQHSGPGAASLADAHAAVLDGRGRSLSRADERGGSRMMDELLKFFVLFFVVVEPITLVPLFAGLTEGADERFRRRMALKAVMVSGVVLLLFAVGGALVPATMGISIDAFRIAGGVMLFLIALEMVFARESGTRVTSEEKDESRKRADISVFPLAFPFIAGPGAIAIVLLTFGASRPDALLAVGLFGVVVLVLAITYALMRLTPTVMRGMGMTGAQCRQPAVGRRARGACSAIHH